jgi:hypothetical protein
VLPLRGKILELVAEIAQTLQAIIDIKKSWLTSHAIICRYRSPAMLTGRRKASETTALSTFCLGSHTAWLRS